MKLAKAFLVVSVFLLPILGSIKTVDASPNVTTVCYYTPNGVFDMDGIEERHSGDVSCRSGFIRSIWVRTGPRGESGSYETRHIQFSLVFKRLE